MEHVIFKPLMFGYAAEDSYNTSKVKVYMPDLFPDRFRNGIQDYKLSTGSKQNVIVNNKPTNPMSASVPISDFLKNRNYLTLSKLNNINIEEGSKLLIGFVNSNPKNGIVLGKAD